jgi:glycosyltransferase involved in cell wall biosynthesis
MAKRKVLHLIDTGGPGGAETIFLDMVVGLSERGWDSVPVVPEIDWLYHALVAAGLPPLVIPFNHSFDVAYVLALRRVIRAHKIDLVQTHLLGSGVYGTLACIGTGVPLTCTLHGQPDIPPTTRFRGVKTRLLRNSDNRVICVSDSLRKHFIQKGDLSDTTITIANGVDASAFSGKGSANIRADLGLPLDTPLVGAVGNVRESKDYPVLILAFAQVLRAQPGAHLVIAGHFFPDGELYTSLLALCDRLGISDSVHFLGFRPDITGFLHDIDAFALSSSDEGFSLATVQAMTLAVPSVVTRSGGPEEIVGDSRGAILVETRAPEALAQALTTLLADPERMGAMAKRGQEHVVEMYSRDKMLDRYETLYQELIS